MAAYLAQSMDGGVTGHSEEVSWPDTLPPGSRLQAPRQAHFAQHPTDGNRRPDLVKFPAAAASIY